MPAGLENVLAFFRQTDENGMTNGEKVSARAQVLRRVPETDKGKSYERAEGPSASSDYPLGVVVEDGRLIGLGIHIFNEDVYPIQSFEITLRGCGLTGHLDLSECREMVILDLYRNEISSVALGSLPAMRILGLQDNHISALDPTGLSACQGIDVGKNRLETLDVSQNTELVELYVNDNLLTSLDTKGNPKLKYLYCHNNGIPSLDATANPLLRHLDTTGNPMVSIRCLAPQREGPLPLELTAGEGGTVGLKFQPVYNAQWKETGEWQQSYHACPKEGYRFVGWQDGEGNILSTDAVWQDSYGASRVLTAVFRAED